MTEDKKKTTKASIGYLIGNYCIKGIGFITVPIFSRLLTTDDFGIYNIFLAYEGMLYLFIELALHESLKNAKYNYSEKLDEYTSSLSILPAVICCILLIIAVVFKSQICQALRLNEATILLLIVYSYCSGMLIYYRYRIALDYKYKEYLFVSGIHAFLNIFLSILLILTVFKESGYMGRIVGGTIACVISTMYILYSIWGKATPKYNKDYWCFGLRIGLPLIPHGLAQIVLIQFDRIMISHITGETDVGLYSFAYTIYSIIQITGSSLHTSFEPWAFSQLHQGGEGKVKLQKISTCYMLLLAGISTVTMLLSPEIIYILGGEKYKASVYCTIPIMLAGFFAMSYAIPSVIEYFKEKTTYVATGTLLAALCNTVLNAFFIPRYGYIAAAYTTLISYILYFMAHLILSKKLGEFHIIIPSYLIGAIVILIVAFLISLIFNYLLLLRVLIAIILCIIGLLMIMKCYGEKNIILMIKNMLKKER